MSCLPLVLPPECDSAKSGHSLDCMMAMWKKAKCLTKGYDAPVNLTSDVVNTYSEMTLK